MLALIVALSPSGRAGGADVPPDVLDAVAEALYERGVELFREGKFGDARQLFLELIERSPGGKYAASARELGRQCEARLGIRTGAFDARPASPRTVTKASGQDAEAEGEPLDPYGNADGDVSILDPYGGANGEAEPLDPYRDADLDGTVLDPYADDPAATGVPTADARTRSRDTTAREAESAAGGEADALLSGQRAREARRARRQLYVYGGVHGLYAGVAAFHLADAGDGALLPLLLAGTGMGLGATWLGTRGRDDLTSADALATMSGGAWGTVHGLVLAEVANDPRDPDDGSDESYFGASLVGGLFGLGAGIGYAHWLGPSAGDVALANSLGGCGFLGGLLVGGVMDPAQTRAYWLNAFIGSVAGLGGGVLLARRFEVSRGRLALVDLGAGLGALLPWLVVYPAVDSDRGVQVTSALSLVTMAGGGYLAWRWTRGRDTAPGASAEAPPSPALVIRGARGAWSLGAPVLRPMISPSRAAGVPDRAFGIDLVAGRF